MSRNGRRATLREVALSAGVSTATVTRALQNSPRVEPDTRDRVVEAVKRLGYTPNPMARSLRTGGHEGPVGLVTAGFTNVFQAGVAAGAERELRTYGLNLIIGSTDDDANREPELAGAMIDRRVSALMMMSDNTGREFLSTDNTFGTPVIFVGRPALGLDADVVMTQDDQSVREATEQLLDLGHRRVAVLAGDLATFRARQRLTGFRQAWTDRGLTEDPELVISGVANSDRTRTVVAALMNTSSPPTAVIALNLGISDGVLLDRIIHHRRYAFIGFDESAMSAGLGISAVIRDPQEVGRQAAALALARGRDRDRATRTVNVDVHFLRRGSGEVPVEDAEAPGS